jgi:farnesyl-diphosphate farnesyltransferase
VSATAAPQALPAERALLERLPECLAAYRALPPADRARVHAVLGTIIEGQVQDLRLFPGEDEGKLAALETREDLDRYTYLVAGCVGEFWTEVHVAHRPRLARWDLPRMRALGTRFGKGLQLTNVLRDVPRDLRQGRCYLPRQDLARGPRAARPAWRARRGAPLLGEWLNTALDHYKPAGSTFAIPRREARMPWPARGRS